MECPYCKEDIKEGAIKCKHCGSMLNEETNNDTPSPVKNSKEEKVFCTADGIKVTSKRFLIGSKTYSISNISSVSLEVHTHKDLKIITVFLSLLLAYPTYGLSIVLGLIIIVGLGGKTFEVVLQTNSGATSALKDSNEEAVRGIVEAINKAIEYKN